MKFNAISYLIGEGFKNLFKNKKMSIASLIIICFTMLIFGVFFAIGENVNYAIKKVAESQGIQVYINDVSEERAKEIGEELKRIQGVNTIQFLSKEDALAQMKDRLKDKSSLLNGYDKKNPFPASYFITLKDLNQSNNVQNEINQMEDIKEISSKDKTISAIINIGKTIRIITGAISIALVIISVFIISNTIKIAVHSRRKEISIMKYVGATNNFIRWPFMVEGIVIGIFSGLVSMLFIGVLYNVVADNMITFNVNLSLTPVSFNDMFTMLVVVYLILGIGIGIIGSAMSMKKYLKV